jgi:cytochrome c peroxidase
MNTILFRSQTARRLLAIVLICGLLMMPGGAAWAANQPPLFRIPVPAPRTNAELAQFAELAKYIKDVPAAVQLGKALFWDMQVGSDGNTACATCHYRAGADPVVGTFPKDTAKRNRNQVNPGHDGLFSMNSLSAPMGPGTLLAAADFPFFQLNPVFGRLKIDPLTGLPADPNTVITRNVDDVFGSQGVPKTTFNGISPGSAADLGTPVSDPTFSVFRQVTGRNSPSVINAVFNYANFWDGRANNIFNGVNPFGPADQSARIFRHVGGALQPEQVAIPNASLASQAVGPPLNPVEMSYDGRTFPELGRKMLTVPRPLNLQLVDPLDSVLGGIINGGGGNGLNLSYTQMIQAAFKNDLWDGPTITLPATINGLPATFAFTQMQANFSLFWGLSIMLYEATLVSDQTPFDRFAAGNLNSLGISGKAGQGLFSSQCAVCHSGSELSNAVIGSNIPNCLFRTCNPVTFTTNTNHNLIQANQTVILDAISDTGFLNLGLRPMRDDGGRAGSAPFLNPGTGQNYPLAFSTLAQLQSLGTLTAFETPSIFTPLLQALLPPVTATTPTAIQSSFKTPGLRNVELNAPYFHNGSVFDLDQVVEFYARGGNFPNAVPGNPDFDNPTLAAKMDPIGSLRTVAASRQNMIDFLRGLTDERVRNEQAPFDHPQLMIPNGDVPETFTTLAATSGTPTAVLISAFTLTTAITNTMTTIVPIGGVVQDDSLNNGVVAVEVTVNGLPGWAAVTGTNWTYTLDAVTGLALGHNTFTAVASTSTPTVSSTITATFDLLPTAVIVGTPSGASKLTNVNLTVSGAGITTYRYSVDNGTFSTDIPVAQKIVLSNLTDAFHTVRVVGKTLVNGIPFEQPEANATTATWRVKATPPVLTVDPIVGPQGKNITISGTVDLGIIPEVFVSSPATAGQVSAVPGTSMNTWTCTITGFKKGTNTITVDATDVAFNHTAIPVNVFIILPDGAFRGAAVPDVSDALKALRIAVGTSIASKEDMLHGDVAPLLDGVPAPDGVIDVSDALLILKKVVNLLNF